MKTFLILFILGSLVSCASNRTVTEPIDEIYPTELPNRLR
jgi:hypothetical protein